MGIPVKVDAALKKRAVSFVVAVAVLLSLLVGMFHNGIQTKAATATMVLTDVQFSNNTAYISPFETRTSVDIYVALDNPRRGHSLTVDIDERLFVNNTTFYAGPSNTVQVSFNQTGNRMYLEMTRDMDTSALVQQDEIYYLVLTVPVVYNQMETRTSYEEQYQNKDLVFREITQGVTCIASVNVEHSAYDLASKADGYLLTSVKKLSWNNGGTAHINTYYNYGHNVFEDLSYVRLVHDWEASNKAFVLDADVTTVKQVYQDLDAQGKVIHDPTEPTQVKQIWLGKTHFDRYKDEINGSFRKSIYEGWYMESEKKNKIQGIAGGFKGTPNLKASDALLVETEIFVNGHKKAPAFDYTKTYAVTATLIGKYLDKSGLDLIDASKKCYPGYDALVRDAVFVFPTLGSGGFEIGKSITITEEFVDDLGNQLQAPIVTKYTTVGNPVSYTQTVLTLDDYDYYGYQLNGGAVNAGQTYSSNSITESITITGVYNRNNMTITEKYVDKYGEDIQQETIRTARRGSSFTGTAPAIRGFEAARYSMDGGVTYIDGTSVTIPDVQTDYVIIYQYEVAHITSDIYDFWYYYTDALEEHLWHITDQYLVSDIKPGTTIQQFMDGIVYAGDVIIYEAAAEDLPISQRTVITDYSRNMGSGMIVSHQYKGEVVLEYYVTIFGDVNGDGLITQTDYDLVEAIILGQHFPINSGQYTAANTSKDAAGLINTEDTKEIENYLLGFINFDQSRIIW